jgi:hypothetical protein
MITISRHVLWRDVATRHVSTSFVSGVFFEGSGYVVNNNNVLQYD